MDLFGESLVDPDSDLEETEDEPPVSDVVDTRSESLVKPSSMTFCLGHGSQEQLLLDLFAKDALPHALIFSGPKGIGKCTFAFRLARYLLKYGKISVSEDSLFGGEEISFPKNMDIDPNDPVFSRVASGGHGDLLYIERSLDTLKGKRKNVIDAETIRRISPYLRKTSAEGGWRVVIIDDADKMNNTAQNAILKILEEPPKKVAIILVTHRIGELIPTIRSRSRLIPFQVLQKDIIRDLLARQGFVYSPTDMNLIIAFSEGSIGQALYFAENDGPELFSEILGLFETTPDWSWQAIHRFSETFGGPGSEKRYELFTQLMVWVFRTLLFMQARGSQNFPDFFKNSGLERFYQKASLDSLLAISEALQGHFQRTEFSNLDKRETVRSAFLVINP
ncbi:MAG: DNA polymerase III subunit delta' [Rhodospirillales bacterium]|nr:DNA polymerase III subunit delta' [Alphaproteobacteria bacterium]MCB1838659.1 DNA polymerase III subunit delta' [Alphaproteobacteria bacterium]MCB9977925.1 DNA polymerase III subunit delta' [Rhodospirillales bacterium]